MQLTYTPPDSVPTATLRMSPSARITLPSQTWVLPPLPKRGDHHLLPSAEPKMAKHPPPPMNATVAQRITPT